MIERIAHILETDLALALIGLAVFAAALVSMGVAP